MTALLLSLAAVAGILLFAAVVGWMVAVSLFPGGASFRAERLGWGFVLGCALLSAMVPISFVVGVTPGWMSFLILGGILFAAARFLPLPVGEGWGEGLTNADPLRGPKQWTTRLLLALLLLGVALYALRALTEPMWSNDYLAIWGFKGKTIFGARALPERFFRWPALGFSHPEYPLGLPFLYAGLASLLGRWDDHSLALLFPFFQGATLLVLFGWLRRRGAPWPLPLAAAALLALFEPLYSGFLTGMAEVPLACGMLLFGTAFSDALDKTDRAALRRVGVASLLIAATKNEGVFLAIVAALVAGILIARRHSVRWPVSAAALLPALAVTLLRRLTLGSVSLRDFDLSFLAPWGIEWLLPRLGESFHAALSEVVLPAWPGLLCVVVLFAVGRRTPHANRLLVLVAVCLAAYVFLPALAVPG
ncbi:MAG: hypothetical protein ACRD1P_08245, partial [Thermoanaerobaculia bacterium]